MATGEITTFPSAADDGGSSSFPPGNFKDPKRLYCKNGGFFLRIKSDGGVDGIREKNDPHSKYFQQRFLMLLTVYRGSLCRFPICNREIRVKLQKIMKGLTEFSSLLKVILHFLTLEPEPVQARLWKVK